MVPTSCYPLIDQKLLFLDFIKFNYPIIISFSLLCVLFFFFSKYHNNELQCSLSLLHDVPYGTYIVFLRCIIKCPFNTSACNKIQIRNSTTTVKEVEDLIRFFWPHGNVRFEYADCIDNGCEKLINSSEGAYKCFSYEADEASIIFRWIYRNYDRLWSKFNPNGDIKKIIFIHAHENSWHCPNPTSKQIKNLLSRNCGLKYFLSNDYGDIYPAYIDLPILNESFINQHLFIQLKLLVEGTKFLDIIYHALRYALKKCQQYKWPKCAWRSSRNSAFFISSQLLSNFSRNDYLQLITNFRTFSNPLNSHIIERGGQAMFTGRGWPLLYNYPNESCFGKIMVSSFVNNDLRTLWPNSYNEYIL